METSADCITLHYNFDTQESKNIKTKLNYKMYSNNFAMTNVSLTQFDPQILISDVYDGKIKY
jgi:hypothetical protein